MKRKRTGVTIPENLLRDVDEFIRLTGIRSRSKVISEALKQYISERRILLQPDRRVIGALIVTYNEKRGDTVRRLIDAQHHFLGEIRATMHVHLSHEKCLEVILVEGRTSSILNLIERIENIIGVELVRFVAAELIEEEEISKNHQ
ncbi:MAG: CopG family ribbon-helix-helix protein [Candidatus Njordarchaeales archaeon]